MALLIRAQFRFLWQNRLQTFLAILGILLGVCVVIAVELTNSSANQSFINAFRATNANVSHRIVGPSTGVAPKDYVYLRKNIFPHIPEIKTAPIIEGDGKFVGIELDHKKLPITHTNENVISYKVRIFGVDPIAETFIDRLNFTSNEQSSEGSRANETDANQDIDVSININQLMLQENSVFISLSFAQKYHLKLNDRLFLQSSSDPLTVVGIFPDTDGYLDNFIICDIDTAQKLTNRTTFSRIDINIAQHLWHKYEPIIQQQLPPGYYLQRTTSLEQQSLKLTQSFQLNLQAMSLLSLLVGIFLVYSTVNYFVEKQLPLFKRLHAIGVLPREILQLILFEVALISIVASSAGVFLAIKLAGFLVSLSNQTINDLYYSTTAAQLFLFKTPIFKGFILGIGASLAAVVMPAVKIYNSINGINTKQSPVTKVSIINPIFTSQAFGIISSAILIVAGVVFAQLESTGIYGGFFSVFSVLLGLAFLTPTCVGFLLFFIQQLKPVFRNSYKLLFSMAVGDTQRNLAKTSVAAMALMIAIASANGMSIMIGSFREAVGDWLSERVSADIYVRGFDEAHNEETFINNEIITAIKNNPTVHNLSIFSDFNAEAATHDNLFTVVNITGAILPEPALQGYQFIDDNNDLSRQTAWERFKNDEVFISETLSNKFSLRVNDTITVKTSIGLKSLTVASIYTDYGNQTGRMLINWNLLQKYWPEQQPQSLGLFVNTDKHLSKDQALENLKSQLQERYKNEPLQIVIGSEIIDTAFNVFDRTFLITHALKIFVLIVALISIFSALSSLMLERKSELITLRTLGFTSSQVLCLLLIQAGVLGLCVGIIAAPVGELLSWMLIEIIHWRSFGWSMPLVPQISVLVENTFFAVLTALVAALYPALRVMNTVNNNQFNQE